MMLYFLSYFAYILYFSFSVLCLASGLYYMAEFVEEYVIYSKKILKYSLQIVLFIHICLLFIDNLPFIYVLLGLISHLLYYKLLSRYPIFEFNDPLFLISCVMAIVDHCSWFLYFSQNYYPFREILAFFTICVWLIPFGFFISLSANENVLPGSLGATIDDTMDDRKSKKSFNVIVSLFDFLKSKTSSNLPIDNFGPSAFEKLN